MEWGKPWGSAWGKDIIGADLMASNFVANFATAGGDLDEHNDDWTRYTGSDLGKRPDARGGFTETISGGVTIRARREDTKPATRISATQPNDLATGDVITNDKGESYRIGKPEGDTRMIFHAVRIERPVAV